MTRAALHLEARPAAEVGVDVLQLGDVVLAVLAELLQLLPVVQELLTRVSATTIVSWTVDVSLLILLLYLT